MGFHVSTLHNLPTGSIRHFVHVIDLSGGLHAQWIEKNLHILARTFGKDAGLVVGPQNLTAELYQFLKRNVTDFGAVEKLLYSATCLVISEGHLAHTQSAVYILPLSLPESSPEAHDMIDTLLRMLGDALQTERLEEFVNELGAVQVGLSAVGGGVLVCTLRRLNAVLELKPNFAGLGLNLNAAIEKVLPQGTRPI